MRRIFLVGYMGVGKTVKGRRLATRFGMDFVDLDEYIVSQTGKSISRIFAEQGENGFRMVERQMLHHLCEDRQDVVVSCGGGTPCFFDNMDYMNSCGETIYLQADVSYILQSLDSDDKERPLLHGLTSRELEDFVCRQLKERDAFYRKAKKTIDAVTFLSSESS